jgi:hypothetical protein
MTAVDWLIEQLQAPCRGIPSDIIEQAKQMEKEQSERMYSEEDLISFYNFIENHQLRKYGDVWKRITNDPKDKPLNFESVDDQYIIEWFEQFKNK